MIQIFAKPYDNNTAFENVYSCPQNCAISIDCDNNVEVYELVKDFYCSPIEEPDYALALDAEIEKMQCFVRARASEYECFDADLSGGADTRFVFALLKSSNLLDKVTFSVSGLDGSADVTIAKMLQKIYSLNLIHDLPAQKIDQWVPDYDDWYRRLYANFAHTSYEGGAGVLRPIMPKAAGDKIAQSRPRGYFGGDGIEIYRAHGIEKYFTEPNRPLRESDNQLFYSAWLEDVVKPEVAHKYRLDTINQQLQKFGDLYSLLALDYDQTRYRGHTNNTRPPITLMHNTTLHRLSRSINREKCLSGKVVFDVIHKIAPDCLLAPFDEPIKFGSLAWSSIGVSINGIPQPFLSNVAGAASARPSQLLHLLKRQPINNKLYDVLNKDAFDDNLKWCIENAQQGQVIDYSYAFSALRISAFLEDVTAYMQVFAIKPSALDVGSLQFTHQFYKVDKSGYSESIEQAALNTLFLQKGNFTTEYLPRLSKDEGYVWNNDLMNKAVAQRDSMIRELQNELKREKQTRANNNQITFKQAVRHITTAPIRIIKRVSS